MKMIIYNKDNFKNASLPISARYKTNNLKEFVIDEGALFTENYNETLDSANIRISHLTEPIDIEPLDRVKIYDDARIGTKYFCVDTYTMKQETLNQDNYAQKFYTYEISLFSETKLLEGVVLPNLSITQLNPNKPITTTRAFQEEDDNYSGTAGVEKSFTSMVYQEDFLIGMSSSDITRGIRAYSGQTELVFSEPPVFHLNNQTGEYWWTFKATPIITNDILTISNIEATKTTNPVKRSIYFYIAKYMTDYSEKIRLSSGFISRITIADRVAAKFANECSEFQWNAPTLREVITDLMMVNDCIPIVRNNTLDYIDLTEVKGEIPSYNYIQYSQSSEDYISDIKMNLQNVMQTSSDSLRTTTTTTEYIPFITSDYAVTTENQYIETQFPILNIKHLWLCLSINNYNTALNAKGTFIKVDLCNIPNMKGTAYINSLVSEYKEYQTLNKVFTDDYSPSAVYNGTNDISGHYSTIQNYRVYYNRGDNKISGWSNSVKILTVGTYQTWQYLFALALGSQVRNGIAQQAITNFRADVGTQGKPHYSAVFEIEYETMADAVFSAGKSDYGANKKTIVDNQTNSWVDAYNQGNLEYQKANRLGNKAILINQRFIGNATPIQIGQTHTTNEQYIVYQTQYQMYKEHMEVNALAVENYVLRDYFTGVNSKVRTWVNAQDEALIRHDLKKIYCEFSFRYKYERDIESFNPAKIRALKVLLANQGLTPIGASAVRTANYANYFPNGSTRYALNQITRLVGNSIVHTFGFNNNAIVGKSINTSIISQSDVKRAKYSSNYHESIIAQLDKDTTDYGGIPLQENYYCNSNTCFEYNNLSVKLANKIVPNTNWTMPNNAQTFSAVGDDVKFLYNSYKMPVVTDPEDNIETNTQIKGVVYNFSVDYLKDNREIPKLSLQTEICSDTRNIYFTKYFMQNHVDIAETTPTLHWYMQSKDYYKNGSTDISGHEYIGDGAMGISLDTSIDGRLVINLDEESTASGWDLSNSVLYRGTSPDNIMFAINSNQGRWTTTIYCNVLNDRDKHVYDSNGIIIGEI